MRAESSAPTSPQLSLGASVAEEDQPTDGAPAYGGDQDLLPASLDPLVAELATARVAIERLANENGTLRERLRLHEAGTD